MDLGSGDDELKNRGSKLEPKHMAASSTPAPGVWNHHMLKHAADTTAAVSPRASNTVLLGKRTFPTTPTSPIIDTRDQKQKRNCDGNEARVIGSSLVEMKKSVMSSMPELISLCHNLDLSEDGAEIWDDADLAGES